MNKEEIEKAKGWLSALDIKSEFEAILKEIILQYIEQLEQENKVLKGNLDRNKKPCFNEDGHTGKCLGYSNVNDDEPCEYCKTCDVINVKEDD